MIFSKKYLNDIIFYLKLTYYIYNTCSRFNDCWVILSRHRWQQTLKMFSTCIKARMDTSGHGLSRAFRTPRAFTNRLTDIKNSLVSVCLKLELNTLGLTVPQVEIKGLGSKGVWALPRKLSVYGHVLKHTFFLVFVRGTHSWSLPTYFRYILYHLSTWISVVNMQS